MIIMEYRITAQLSWSIPAKACYLLTSSLPKSCLYTSDAIIVSGYSFSVRYGRWSGTTLQLDVQRIVRSEVGLLVHTYGSGPERAETPRCLHTFRLEVVG